MLSLSLRPDPPPPPPLPPSPPLPIPPPSPPTISLLYPQGILNVLNVRSHCLAQFADSCELCLFIPAMSAICAAE